MCKVQLGLLEINNLIVSLLKPAYINIRLLLILQRNWYCVFNKLAFVIGKRCYSYVCLCAHVHMV